MAKKWAQKVDLKEGALTKIGGLNASAIMRNVKAGKVDYATAMRRMVFLANVGNPRAKRVVAELKRLKGSKK